MGPQSPPSCPPAPAATTRAHTGLSASPAPPGSLPAATPSRPTFAHLQRPLERASGSSRYKDRPPVNGECGCRCFRLPLPSPPHTQPSHPAASPGLPSCLPPHTSCPQDKRLHSQAHCLWPPSPGRLLPGGPSPAPGPERSADALLPSQGPQSRAPGEKGEGAVPSAVDRPHPFPPCGCPQVLISAPAGNPCHQAPAGQRRALGLAAFLLFFFSFFA